MTIGVYSLSFTDGSIYIGVSNNISKRISNHSYLLRKNAHYNNKLQYKFTEFGPPTVTVLRECTESSLSSEEKHFVSLVPADKLLNLVSAGRFGSGQQGEAHGCSVYSNRKLIEVFQYLLEGLSYLDIEKITGVKYKTIGSISSGNQHKWLEEIYGNLYTLHILNHKNFRPYQVVSPANQIFTVTNQKQFCSDHKLHYSNFSRMLKGFRKSAQGWKLVQGDNN